MSKLEIDCEKLSKLEFYLKDDPGLKFNFEELYFYDNNYYIIDGSECYKLSDKLHIITYYLNVRLKDINDNGYIVLEFSEGEKRNTIWIDKNDYKIFKTENDIINEIYDENSNVTIEKINMKSVYKMDENVVSDEDIKWIDLTGKTVTILD